MALLLLDSSLLIDVLNDRNQRAERMESMILEGHDLAICPVNVAEIYAGMRSNEAAATEDLMRQFIYIPIRWNAARLAGELKSAWTRRGHKLSLADTIIAAVCIIENLTLVTDNRRHFPMPELSMYQL